MLSTNYDISASIVLYQNDYSVIQTIKCFLDTSLKVRLFLIDNSPTDDLHNLCHASNVEYVFNNMNFGFGGGHNIAIKRIWDHSKYHLVLNPDVEFELGTLERITDYMNGHSDVGLLMPKVYYKDGEIQRLCKLLPSPFDLFLRRFVKNASWAQKHKDRYEMQIFNYDKEINVPNLSGCFMFLRTSILKQVGLFDPRYFMYLEDIDLTRRIHKKARTIFYPEVSIMHGFQKGSYSHPKLLQYHIGSAVKYFNKWGWFWDIDRKRINTKILTELSND